jgi:GH18 family chitinase
MVFIHALLFLCKYNITQRQNFLKMKPLTTIQPLEKIIQWGKVAIRIPIIGTIVLLLSTNVLGQKSIHQEQLEYYNDLGKVSKSVYDSINNYKPRMSAKASSDCSLEKIVYGFWPYWGGSTYTNFDWSLISDLVYFSYEINPSTGAPSSVHDWATSEAVNAAIENDVRVSICANLFASHSTFLESSTAKQNFITTVIDLLKSRGGKGVCIDFEGVSSSHNVGITTFMESLSEQVHSNIAGSIVTICLPAVEWSDKFDVAAMMDYVDYFVIMGYDYYYSGSAQAGPVGPLYSMTSAYNYNLNRSVSTWINKGADKDKLILGLPYYGREWSTESNSIPSNTTGSSSSRTFKYVKDNSSGFYSSSNLFWNNSSFTPYYVFQNDGWRQCFMDNGLSLGKRIDLINQRNLAGMGIWALGYDDGYNDYWNQISSKLSSCKVFPAIDSIFDSGGPEQNYFNNEDYITTITAPEGTDELALSFKSFELESGADSLYIYNGTGTDYLIGGYSDTNSPGNIIIEGNSFTFRVKHDASTTKKGWSAIWRANVPYAIDDFEDGAGHFTTYPTYSGSTEGISSESTLEHQTTTAHNSSGAMMAVFEDDINSDSDWTIRLLSAVGVPADNTAFSSEGSISFWMISESANSDASVQIWIDDSDGLEISPTLPVINDGVWHQYIYSLSEFNGSPYAEGNGSGTLDGDNVTLDAIVLKQSDNSEAWKIYLDDIVYYPGEVAPDTILYVPVPILPIDNSAIAESPISFSWSCPTSGAEFILQISDDLDSWNSETGFSTVIFSQNVEETTSYTWENAIRGKTYFWSVQAKKDDDHKSLFSNPLKFTVEQTVITLDDFEISEGHFDKYPTYSGSTVGISSESTLERITNASFGGIGSLKGVLKDDTQSSSDWFVRLLSGTGDPNNNITINNFGVVTFWLKTKSAAVDAEVQIWVDDSDGLETTQFLPIINDDRWHKYSFDLTDFDQSSAGNGVLDSPIVTLDAIIFKQSESSSDWTITFDDVEYDAGGTGTKIIQSDEEITMQKESSKNTITSVIYPNPNHGLLNIDFPDTKYTVEIINISGSIVYKSETQLSNSQIDISDLPDGVYIIRVNSKNSREVHRLLLNH